MPCFKKPERDQIQHQFEKDSKDHDLMDCGRRWYESELNHHYKQRALKQFEERYVPLLAFFRENKLVKDPEFGIEVQNWYQFELRRSHLTELGIAIYYNCVDGWLRGLDRGTKPTHLRRWEQAFGELKIKVL